MPSPANHSRHARDWLLNHLQQVDDDPAEFDLLSGNAVADRLQEQEADSDHTVRRIAQRAREMHAAATYGGEVASPPQGTPSHQVSAGRSPTTRPPQARVRRTRWVATSLVVACLVVIAVGTRIQPLEVRLADIQEERVERARAVAAVSKSPDAAWEAFEQGWMLLQTSPQHILGFSSGYDEKAVRSALPFLETAYRLGKSGGVASVEAMRGRSGAPPLGLCAYLIAQSHLILQDLPQAHRWLETAVSHRDEPWFTAAQTQLSRLPPADD